MWLRHPGTGADLRVGGFDGGTDLASTIDTDGNTAKP